MCTQQTAPADRPVLIMAHGAGSTADFLSRAFPASACGAPVRYLDDRTGDPGRIAEQLLREACDARQAGAAPLLGGVSVGAHAAAAACLAAPAGLVRGCVLVMPAWSGPCPAASPTAIGAAEVAAVGAAQVLRRLDQDSALRTDWVVDELHRAWRDRPTIAAELAAAARSRAPGPRQLRRLALPTLVTALTDDPVHPLAVARCWAAAVPGSQLRIVQRSEPGRDLAVFGRLVGDWLRSVFSAPR